MALAIVRLGSPRLEGEGLRIGTVRRPPRGVPKHAFASQDWYDVWFPNLAPSSDTMKLGPEGRRYACPLGRFLQAVQGRDGHSLCPPRSGAAGCPLPYHQSVGGLLLRAGVSLSSQHIARAAGQLRRQVTLEGVPTDALFHFNHHSDRISPTAGADAAQPPAPQSYQPPRLPRCPSTIASDRRPSPPAVES